MRSTRIERFLPVPKRYRGATFEGFLTQTKSQTQALAAARRLAAGEARSLVLIGAPGVGKSHLAAAIVRAISEPVIEADQKRWEEAQDQLHQWQEQGGTWNERPDTQVAYSPLPTWANVPSMVVDLRFEMSLPPDDQATNTLARRLRSAPQLVILDDLGREKISEWTGELIYTIVNARYEDELATFASSNLSREELVASDYWPAISRLAEDGSLIEITAPDHRLGR